ncbi:MAG: hypothetical protein JSW61_08225 [Candidatus Thorarchaeota archaeon]|nr:MAG: hypothetical protein JSW61_08225 [Candidatus Thorarchaeota archaeon]
MPILRTEQIGRRFDVKQASVVRFYTGPNPGGIWDAALDEAILRVTCEDHGPLTVRVWLNKSPVLVLPRSPMQKEGAFIQECSTRGIHVTRGLSGRRCLLHGPSVLSFSLVDESNALASGDLEREICQLLSPVIRGIQSEIPTSEIAFDQGHVIVGESIVGAFNTSYYFDYLMLQGVVHVHSNQHFTTLKITKEGTRLTCLDQIQSHVSSQHIMDAIKKSIAQNHGLQMTNMPASVRVTELMTELHQWKYTNNDWVYHQLEPLALGRILLESYLAYPPTNRCREIIAIVDEISKKYADKVECRKWLRGRGLMSWLKGVPPGLRPSGGVVQASKKNIVPAVVVQGNITHERKVPVYDDLCEIVETAYNVTFGGTSE